MDESDKIISISDLARKVWLKRRNIMRWMIMGFAAGVIIAFSLPKEYVSAVTMVPESKSKNNSMGSMSGIAAVMGVGLPGMSEDGINESIYPEIIKSSPFLLKFKDVEVEKDGLKITLYRYLTREQKSPWWFAPVRLLGWLRNGNDEKADGEDDEFNHGIEQRRFEKGLSSRIVLKSDKKSRVISISIKMQDARTAAIMADMIVKELQQYMTEYQTSKARYDLENSQAMLEIARQKYYQADRDYALAQDLNQNLIRKTAQVKLDRLNNEKNLAFSIYQQLASQVEMCKIKLQEDTPIVTIIEPARVPVVQDSPNKKLIVLAMVLLGAIISVGAVVVRSILSSDDDGA